MVKRKQKKQSSLSRVLASANDRAKVVRRFFTMLTPTEIGRSVSQLNNHRHFRKIVNLKEQSPSEFYVKRSPNVNLAKNIAWCLGIVSNVKDELTHVVGARIRISELILTSDISAALSELDAIDANCGISAWAICLRASLLSRADDTVGKNTLLQKISEDFVNNGFFKSLANNLTDRYDEIGVGSSDRSFFARKIERYFSGEMLHFLLYKLVKLNADFEYDFSHILNIEKHSSIVDILYCLENFVCCSELHFDNSSVEGEQSLLVLKTLVGLFPASPLRGFLGIHGEDDSWDFSDDELEIVDLYTQGDYEAVCRKMSERQELAFKFTLFELWARSATRHLATPPPGMLGELLLLARNLLLKTEDYTDAAYLLGAQAHAFATLPWFRELAYFVEREVGYYSVSRQEKLDRLMVGLSQVNSPLRAKYFPVSLRNLYISQIEEAHPRSCATSLFDALTSETLGNPGEVILENVSTLRAKSYMGKWNFSRKDYKKSAEIFEKLSASEDVLIARDATRDLITSFIELDLLELAAEVYVEAVLTNKNTLSSFDGRYLCKKLTAVISKSKSIYVPIAFSIYSSIVSGEFASELKYSFESFLINIGVKLPLDIVKNDGIDGRLKDYFLAYVAVPEVMKLYLEFDSAKDIEKYRVLICQHLIDRLYAIDGMIREAKERSRQLVLIDATKHVEKSRIYADTSVLSTGSIAAGLKQLCERALVLRANDYSLSMDEIAFSSIYESGSVLVENAFLIHVQDVALNEKNITFLKIMKLVRDELTFGPKGLAGYLSTRIRHGHLPNTLRKAVADTELLAKKLTTSSGFKRNDYWLGKFSGLSLSVASDLENYFQEFSSEFYAAVEEINEKWLQINTIDLDLSALSPDTNSEGALFNYSVTAFEAYIIQREAGSVSSYSEMLQVLIGWFWNRTERNLLRIREAIGESARERLLSVVSTLEERVVRRVREHAVLGDFCDAVATSRGNISAAIDTVAGWFNRSTELSVPSFELDLPITIARLSAGAEVKFFDASNMPIHGRALTSLVDVFYVLFENCVGKSELSKENLLINCEISLSEDDVILTVVNNCADVGSLKSANSRLDVYRKKYGQEDLALRAAQGEGGSGFYKIWKALAKDLDLEHRIEFGYSDNETFKVKITMARETFKKVCFHEDTNS